MPERVAILVIHGIGQQKPYETLDQFSRNLLKNFGKGWTVTPQLDRAVDPMHIDKAWVRTSYVLSPPPGQNPAFTHDPANTIQDITLFEYYWAPITQGKITYKGSLLFLIRAGLIPFLYLFSNIDTIRKAENGSFAKALFRELWRQICFFLPLLLLLTGLLVWLSGGSHLPHSGHVGAGIVVSTGVLAVRYLYLISTARALLQSRKMQGGMQTSWWFKPLLVFGILCHVFLWPFLLAPFLNGIAWCGSHFATCFPWIRNLGHASTHLHRLAALFTFPCGAGWLQHLKSLVFLNGQLAVYTGALATLLLAIWLRYILTDIVGDVAVYVNADTFASSYAARTQILGECSATLSAILLEKRDPLDPATLPKFDRVLIAAHSLGSIIAYDTMNQLLNVARTATPTGPHVATPVQAADLVRLRGLVTFGCPLNKIFYFFRPLDSPQLTLRAQTLNLLYGFRLKACLMDNQDVVPWLYPFHTPPMPSEPPAWGVAERALEQDFRWINAYSPMDPVSGHLVFYSVEAQISINNLPPLVAHVRYWENESFYHFVRTNLL